MLDERRLGPRRLRRHPRRRPRVVAAAAAGPPRLRAGRRHHARRTRRQGHHVRLRRPVDQAGGGHGRDEERHVRCRRRAAHRARRSRSSGSRSGSPAGSRSPRTCRRGRRSARRTSSPSAAAAPSRCSTPTPRAASCSPTRSSRPARRSPTSSSTSPPSPARRWWRSATAPPRSWPTTTTSATRVHAVADRVGEQFWPMPLPPELRASMDSRVADIANIGDRFGGMLVAGLFLKEFVPTRGDGDDAEPGAVGPPGHRRAGLQHRFRARLHARGRHRGRAYARCWGSARTSPVSQAVFRYVDSATPGLSPRAASCG